MYIMTIDVGTGSGRATLFDEKGREVAVGQREWVLQALPEYPGALRFDTEKAWRCLTECIREAMGKSGAKPLDIAGVAATSMREGMVLYNREKKEIWACPNADARARSEVEDMIAAGLAEPIYRTGGDWLSIVSPARFWWIKRNLPELYKTIAFMSMLSDWVLFKLSGEIVTDVSCGSSSGIFDLAKRTWSTEIVEAAGLPKGIYPPVYESATIVGRVTSETALVTSLAEGTPVITAGADTQMALLGTGAVVPGMLTVVGGTFWQTTLVTDSVVIDPEYRLRTLCHAVPDQWMVEGISFYVGFTMRWFRDAFCSQEVSEGKARSLDPYFLMERLAEATEPGAHGVQALFSNVMDARHWKHGVPAFMGFDIMNPNESGRGACIRAIEEQAAYTSRAHLEILKGLVEYTVDHVTFCGGSAKGFLWPKILADVLGMPVRIPVIREATSLGSYLCAATAIGWYESLQQSVKKGVLFEREVIPEEKNVNSYVHYYDLWLKLYPYVLSIADKGLLPSMWRGPGT
jgi:autoinducer 2 (AI-2) kinase